MLNPTTRLNSTGSRPRVNTSAARPELTVYETLGGKFDNSQAVNTDSVGTATLTFTDCGLGRMNYTIDTLNMSGSFPLQRAIQGSDNICQQRQANTTQSVNIRWRHGWCLV